jgi:hypothetical protein
MTAFLLYGIIGTIVYDFFVRGHFYAPAPAHAQRLFYRNLDAPAFPAEITGRFRKNRTAAAEIFHFCSEFGHSPVFKPASSISGYPGIHPPQSRHVRSDCPPIPAARGKRPDR